MSSNPVVLTTPPWQSQHKTLWPWELKGEQGSDLPIYKVYTDGPKAKGSSVEGTDRLTLMCSHFNWHLGCYLSFVFLKYQCPLHYLLHPHLKHTRLLLWFLSHLHTVSYAIEQTRSWEPSHSFVFFVFILLMVSGPWVWKNLSWVLLNRMFNLISAICCFTW